MTAHSSVLTFLGFASIGALAAAGAEGVFFRAGIDTDRPVWGVRGGLQFGVWPGAIGGERGPGGPRGLIRIGYPIMPDGSYRLVNFIAVEPIVRGKRRRGFSELEVSARDGKRGKLIEPGPPPGIDWDAPAEGALYPGDIETLDGGATRLTVCLRVEKFSNGAHVYLLASVRTDRLDELELRVFAEDDCAPLDACILTATMGNLERLRQVHLSGRVVTSQELYGSYEGEGFTPHTTFPLEELPRAADGSITVAATTDEDDPSSTRPDPKRPWFWHYPGAKVTQYWRKYPGTFDESLQAKVNARRVYWASKRPIPNGIAFENFELNESFIPGQTTSFGLTPLTPEALLGL